MNAPVALGLDLGSTTAKLVGVDATGAVVLRRVEPTEPRMEAQAERLRALAEGSPPLVATGYGRGLVKGARQVTEITCHARGVFWALGRGGTLVDVGGQDTKVILVDDRGRVQTFAMNDKCAAGTGRFLEVAAGRLQIALPDLGNLALSTREEAHLSSTCTVFAESEMVSLLARGAAVEAVVRGLHRSLVRRVAALVRSTGRPRDLLLSGGGALNPALRRLLGEEIGVPVFVAEDPQVMGAWGAALAALDGHAGQADGGINPLPGSR